MENYKQLIHRHHILTPTIVTTTTLNIPQNYKQKCIQEAYRIGDQQNQKTNVKAIMSSYTLGQETKQYNLLINQIFNFIKSDIPPPEDTTYKLTNFWFNIYKEGHYTIPHHHLPCNISFVYYLQTNNDSSPLIFEGCDFTIDPFDDLLVVFQSHLIHSVPEHVGKDRISISGNIKLIETP